MDEVEVSAVIYRPPDEVFEFITDFPRYARYSEYLDGVRQHGDGSAGTHYDIRVSWWKLSYTARSKVTDVDPPRRLDWRLVRDADARGYWGVEPAPDAGNDGDASRARLYIAFDPDSVQPGTIELPRFVSFDWLVRKLKPKVLEEAQRIVERMVTDIEGERRPVDLVVHTTPSDV